MKYTSWEADEYEYFCRGLDFAEAIDGAALSLSDLKKRAKLLSDHKSKNTMTHRLLVTYVNNQGSYNQLY